MKGRRGNDFGVGLDWVVVVVRFDTYLLLISYQILVFPLYLISFPPRVASYVIVLLFCWTYLVILLLTSRRLE